MVEPILVAQAKQPIFLLPKMANRHGLIAGATGTGKTVTLQTLAKILVPVVWLCSWPTSKAISPA
jgi:Cdc6-like AAA superfamily ATPase